MLLWRVLQYLSRVPAAELHGWSPPVVGAVGALVGAATVGTVAGVVLPSGSEEPRSVTMNPEVPQFHSIEVWDPGAGVDLNVHADLPQRVTITADVDAEIRLDVRGDALVISGQSDRPVRVSVALPKLDRLVLWGDTRARVRAIDSDALAVTLADTAWLQAEGVVTRLELVVDSHSLAQLETLSAQEARVTASGASRVDVSVGSKLSATVGDQAGVFYRGNPEVSQHTHRGGTVTQKR